ncbi:MAG: PfkB family carbohydrate kinase [Oscillospiraceae bacterium]|jgi:pseudouridine kinase
MIRYDHPEVFGAGAANFDINCVEKEPPLVMKDSNLVGMLTSSGGVTRNIIENLARLGVKAAMLTAYGDDAYGDRIRKDGEAAGIDLSRVKLCRGCISSCYVSVQDADGDMALGLADMSVLSNLDNAYFDSYKGEVSRAKAAVCDPSLPLPLLEHYIFDTAAGCPVFLDPVSTNFARQCVPLLKGVDTFKPNIMELETVTGISASTDEGLEEACRKAISLGVRRVVVSRGKKGCFMMDNTGKIIKRKFKPVEKMVNATGAGDSFMAGLIYGFINGFDDDKSLDYALAMGIIAVLSEHTIDPGLNVEKVERCIKEYRTTDA